MYIQHVRSDVHDCTVRSTPFDRPSSSITCWMCWFFSRRTTGELISRYSLVFYLRKTSTKKPGWVFNSRKSWKTLSRTNGRTWITATLPRNAFGSLDPSLWRWAIFARTTPDSKPKRKPKRKIPVSAEKCHPDSEENPLSVRRFIYLSCVLFRKWKFWLLL